MENKKPDWRIKDDYEYASNSFWDFYSEKEFYAWQFLRRNPEYQQDYEKELAKYKERNINTPPNDMEAELLCGFKPDDPKIAAKWGLVELFDPKENTAGATFKRRYGRVVFGNLFRVLYGLSDEFEEESEEVFTNNPMVSADKIAIEFEISLSIPPQIELAKTYLSDLQNEITNRFKKEIDEDRRPHVSIWPDYLRVYDAYTEGFKRKEIASIIFPGQENKYPNYNAGKKVATYKKQAEKLINGGYKKEILIWS
ncbi:MAG TPA: hypothetical protein DCR95_11500 [Desulfobacter sp.]|nr:hypothetical protein [Desulfobacter sp.]